MNNSLAELILSESIRRAQSSIAELDYRPKDPVGWILEHFRIPKDEAEDLRLVLAPYQVAALRRALSRDARGLFRYTTVLWSDIKKSIKCLHPLTDVLMGDGSLKCARDVTVGDTVLSYRNGGYYFNTVYAKECQPPSPMYRVTTSRGRILNVTGEHPFLVEGMRGRYPSYKALNKLAREKKWIKASSLSVGDRVIVGLGWMNHDWVSKSCENPDEMYALGVWIGDGGGLVITNADDGVITRVRKTVQLNKIKGSKFGYGMKGGASFLRKFGLYDTDTHLNSRTKFVPKQVFQSGREGIAQFLSGYFDTDGHVSKLTRKQPMAEIGSVNRGLLEACQWLLSGLGINAILRKAYTNYKGVRVDVWYLVVQGKEAIVRLSQVLTLSCNHKRERLAAWAKRIEKSGDHKFDSFSTDRVTQIELLPEEESIALSVSGDENHITNGLVTHNSTVAAAVTLWSAWHSDFSQCYIVANTRDQADSRVAYYLRRAIELNPNLRKVCEVNRSSFLITLPNHATIKAIAVNAAGEAGGNPRFIEFTELWGATTSEAERLWTETTTPPNLFGKSQRWVDTYAGFEGESKVLEQLYATGVLEGVRCDNEYDFFYENVPARMFALWNTSPRLAWQTEEYYASERRTLTSVSEFLRVHRNQWSGGSELFVPPEWLASCQGEIPRYAGEPCVAALDGGLTDDSFALVVLDKSGDVTRTRYSNAWYPLDGKQIDFVGTPDSPGPELEIERLAKLYNVIEWAYDKTHIADMMSRLEKRLGIHVYDFSQGERRLMSDAMLRQNIRDRRFLHNGEYNLTSHILNANAKITRVMDSSDKSGQTRETLRIIKRNQKLKIDAAVACSMANWELREAYHID